ncbi:hypothetical protein EA187_09465 [Lujinxingia sediminis]|uniref:PpiC domain-containing protein n=1 Tax=Lujinxingia sediminis TaxID=2480984 RepID=A0ABY0CUA0_9DELT|nr:hypothetical protein [Lujinxingia sediminis]RVU44759.1 hypothetical protein EA187_09465 [Lujinxingia sediminis]
MRSWQQRGWGVVVLALLMGCAEEQAGVAHPPAEKAMERVLAASPQPELARVGEVSLGVRELEIFWEAHPELGRQEAMRALIEETMLWQEAYKLGLHARPEAGFARKQGLVNAFLDEEVEAEHRVDAPSEDFVAILQKNADFPRGYRSSHLVIVVPGTMPGDEKFGADRRRELREERFERAQAWIEASAESLEAKPTLDALLAEAQRLNREVLPAEYQAVVNAHMRFARPAEGDVSQRLPDGWIQVVPEFSRAADLLASEHELGTLSEPVRSPVGWHLLKVDEKLESQPADPREVERFAAAALTREDRAQAYTARLSALLEGARVEMRPERLQDEVPGS